MKDNMMKKTTLLALALCVLPLSVSADGFRKLHRTWMDEGQVIHPATLRQVTTGLTKSQVYRIIGSPHFNEGIGAETWNYIFQLRVADKQLASNCQYLLHYHRGRIDQIGWKDEACARAAQ
jgi:outer membrane protein assembly factor BamE (lipoprotein component of BamABCDE complex)